MNILALFRPVRAFIFDVDGVMTDGTLQVLDRGTLVRRMHIRDGYALQLAVRCGYRVAVISGARSEAVAVRLEGLGVRDLYFGVEDKKSVLASYLQAAEMAPEEVLYMGDDLPDYEAMQLAGLRCCPSDACPEIRQTAHYISPYKGGEGCVRDVLEKVLKLRGDWPGSEKAGRSD